MTLIEIRDDENQVSILLLEYNIKRYTKSSKRWPSVEEFREFVETEVRAIEGGIIDKLIALGWTPPKEEPIANSTKIEAFLRWMALQECYKFKTSSSSDKRNCRELYKGCGFFHLKLCPVCRAYVLQHGE